MVSFFLFKAARLVGILIMTKTIEGCSHGVEENVTTRHFLPNKKKQNRKVSIVLGKKTEHGIDLADTRGIMSAVISWMGSSSAQKRSSNKKGLDNAIHMWQF